MKKWSAILGIVVAIVGAGYIAANRGLNKPDDILIRELMHRGETAVERKDLKMAMSCISTDFRNSAGGNYDGLRLFVAQAFRSEMSYSVQLDAPDITINGNSAKAVTKVSLYNTVSQPYSSIFSGSITLILQKETQKRYWVFPVKEWKIISFSGPFGNWLQDESSM